MLNQLKALQKGNLEEVKDASLFPLMKWLSGSKNNIGCCSVVNRLFYFAPPRWLLTYLSLTNNRQPFIKYPKPTKFSDKKFDVLVKYLQKKHKWSKREVEHNKEVILLLLNNKEFIEDLANKAGFEDKERKLFGLGVVKFVKPKIRKEKTLFSF